MRETKRKQQLKELGFVEVSRGRFRPDGNLNYEVSIKTIREAKPDIWDNVVRPFAKV